MTARLLLKALLVHNGRIGVALASLAVGAAVVSALCGLYLDISIKMSEELRAYGANFILSPVPQEDAGDDAGDGAQGLPLGRLTAALQEIPAERLVGASPFLHGLARLDLGNAVIVGVDFAGLRALSPYWQVEGTWVGVSFDTRNAMVGRHLADTMELGVGDTVTIQDRALARRAEVTIRGIVDTGGREDDQLFVGLEVAGAVLGLEDRADFIMASVVAEGAEADALAAAVSAADPAVTGRPIRRISANDGEILDRIDGLMAVVAATILVITTLCVNATLTAMVAKRAPEIGLQKALGADDRAIVRQFLSETTILCVVGVTAGLILGYGLAQILGQAVFGSWVAFRPVVVPVTLGVSLAAALIAAVLPVRGAVRVAPARVLRGE
ncbi:MAG: ABC transporter permease [Rhodospirillaceae bacterium]|nr:ABC transporter permease [Rhodospirillaceae bacterium]